MKVVIFNTNNTKDFPISGLAEFQIEMYEKYRHVEFIEFSIVGKTFEKEGNVKRVKLNKKNLEKYLDKKIDKAFFNTFTKKYKLADKKNNKLGIDKYYIDHGNWPKTFMNKEAYISIPLSKKIWANWNFAFDQYYKRFISTSTVITFTNDDARIFKDSKKTMLYIPYFNFDFKNTKSIKEYDFICIGRNSLQKNVPGINKFINENPKFKFAIAGGMSSAIKSSNVTNLGYLEKNNLLKEILKSKSLLFLSHYEGLPRVIIESLKLGTLVNTNLSSPALKDFSDKGYINIISKKGDNFDLNYKFDSEKFAKELKRRMRETNKLFDNLLK